MFYCFIVLALLHLASVWTMTKRDSSFANLESPHVLMSSPRRRQVVIEARRDRGAASSDGASSSSNANHSWGLAHSRHEASRSMGEPQHFGYAAMIPSVPLPSANNMLLSDREYNAPILEKLEIPPADPNSNPIQLFTASDLAHLSSHLAITAQTLSQHAQNQELDDISEISD